MHHYQPRVLPSVMKTIEERLAEVQNVIKRMTYNTNSQGKPHFNTDKRRQYCDIMATARDMLAHPQPIKCLESVMLALHLTNHEDFHGIDRVPLGFKSMDTVTGHDHRHIVLAIRDRASDKWGALGLSRDTGLMWKPLLFPSFSSLVTDYFNAYHRISHHVLKLRIGLPVPHNGRLTAQVIWRAIKLRTESSSWDELCNAVDQHAQHMSVQAQVAYNLSI